jgi:hypothetical protein
LEERDLHKLMKKNPQQHLRLSRHGEEELELAGEYGEQRLGWQEEEGGTVFI